MGFKRLKYITVDDKSYKYVTSCVRCGKEMRVRILVEMFPNRLERLTASGPIKKEELISFIREKALDK